MKTLIFYGSPRENGHTMEMVNLLLEHLGGDIEIIDAYKEAVAPCIDCRYCWDKKGCSIKDGMQAIYEKIEAADNIVFASPTYFNGVPGPLKMIIDRLQVYWAGKIRKDKSENHGRKGAILLVGGAPEFKDQFAGAELTISRVFKDLNTKNLGSAKLSNSDKVSLETRAEVRDRVIALAKRIQS